MDAAQLREARRKIAAQAALQSPAMMGRFCRGRAFHVRAHTKVIDDALLRLGHDVDRLLVTTPPRAGKSWLTSEMLPLWWLANHSSDRIAVVSYAADLALGKSKAVRTLVQQRGEPLGLTLARGSGAVKDWSLTTGGGIKAVGVDGGLTGHGASLVIADDVISNRQDAESPLMQRRLWDWWSGVLLSRLTPGAPVVLTMTRWSGDDIAARVLKHEGRIEEGGRWLVVHLEAIATGTVVDPLGRKPGEPLTHPLIEDTDTTALLKHWDDKRRTSTPRDWSALYQGSPIAQEGALVDADLMAARTHLTGQADPVRVVVAIDPSGGGKDSAGIVAGYLGTDDRVWITHDRTGVMSSDKWARTAVALAAEVDADRICYEKNYGGDLLRIALRTAHRALSEEGALPDGWSLPYLHPVVARRGKLLRAEPVAQQIREDVVRLGAQLPELVGEWLGWSPTSGFSPGRVDASVYLVRELLPRIGSGKAISSATDVRRDQFRGGGGIVRRSY